MYQKIVIVGNLGRDPEMRYMPDGTAVTNISVATSEKVKKNGVYTPHTTWFRVTVWGKQGENVNQYLSKGSKVLVEGRLKSNDDGNPTIWTTNSGEARANFDITADTVRFLSGRSDDGSGGAAAQVAQGQQVEDDGFPF